MRNRRWQTNTHPHSQSKNSLVQCFFCSIIAVRINYELLVFQVVRLSITVQIRILSTGSWSPSSYPRSPLQDDSKRDRNQKGLNFWAQRQLSTPSPTWYSSYLGKGTFSWSCRAGGLGSRPCASISCLWGRRFFFTEMDNLPSVKIWTLRAKSKNRCNSHLRSSSSLAAFTFLSWLSARLWRRSVLKFD